MPPGFANKKDGNAAEVVNEDNGVLSNVLRYLGRPGFAFRSLLAGDLEGAGANIGQMLLDTPTLGFVNRDLSLANLVESDDNGDITTKAQQRQFTDLMKDWGADAPSSRGFGENLAYDLVGGFFTDPLTLLSGPAKGLAQGSLAGMARVPAQRLALEALKATPKGVAAVEGATQGVLRGLAGASDELTLSGRALSRLTPAGRDLAARVASRAGATSRSSALGRALSEVKVEDVLSGTIDPKILGRGASTTRVAALQRGLAQRAAEKVFWETADVGPLKFAEDLALAGHADEGIAALERAALTRNPSALAWRIPFTKVEGDVIPGFWSRVGRFGTAPGLVRTLADQTDATRPIAAVMDEGFERALDWGRTLWDKTLSGLGKVPEGLRQATREAVNLRTAKTMAIQRQTVEAFGNIPVPDRQRLGKLVDDYADLWRNTIDTQNPSEIFERFKVSPREGDDALREWLRQSDLGLAEGPPPKVGDYTDKAMLTMSQGRIPPKKDLEAFLETRLKREAGDHAGSIDVYLKAMRSAREELLREFPKQWHDIGVRANPFYLAHQADPLYLEMIGESFKNKDLSQALLDARKYGTGVEFRAELERIAKQFGIEPQTYDTFVEATALGGQGAGFQQHDIGALFRERLMAQAHVVMKAQITRKAERLGMQEGDALHKYLGVQFATTQIKDNKLYTLLSGGKITMQARPGLKEWAERYDPATSLFRRKVSPDGKQVEVLWPGLSPVWKAAMTSNPSNISYHTRNILGSTFAGAFDPDVGLRGSLAVFKSALNGGLVKTLDKAGFAGDDLADAVRYLSDDPAVSKAALERLKSSGKTVGPYDWNTVAKTLDAVAAPRVNQADLMASVGSMDALGREFVASWDDVLKGNNGPRMRTAWQRWTKLGEDMANGVEARFRSNAALHMLRKGVDPTEVVRRVERMFVGYKVNTVTERWLRTTVPFLRYSIGSAAWLKNIASSPRLVNWAGHARGSAENTMGDNAVLPERAAESLALPLPWKTPEGNMQFLLSTGLPVEVSMNLLGLATPSGFRRQILAGMQPVLKVPLEMATNRSFYFGDEWGRYTKAPAWVPRGLTQEIELPDGTKRYEIRGEINELLNALPTSRLDSMINSMVSENRSGWGKVLQTVTGARTMSVDTEAELKKRLQSYLADKVRSGQAGETMIYFSRLDDKNTPEDLKIVLAEMEALKKRSSVPARRGFARP